ncbi:hypothetical protein FSPOR_11749 [Fusarium sporotrichioides]|uniref:Uncharacterized protein n=1 Tax=Fusarium sporotrichioides TaxID=5514 RepID=A0A395RFG9_FUSSP|nr:hypothetical protein FSPOR_11749 [Fusarium sporotrichioides]
MPKTRRGGMPNQRTRVLSQMPQIGQLDTTPTSRHLQSPQVDNDPEPPSAQPQESTNEYDGDIDDGDLTKLTKQVSGAFWSEGASTRRSTPLDSPFDDSSSQKSGSGKLPSTQPLPSQLIAGHSANNGQPLVDFSETATTARRSSPYLPQTTLSQSASDMRLELPEYNTVPELPGTIPDSFKIPMDHLPEDELYDATPVPEDREEQAAKEEKRHTVKSKPPQRSAEKAKASIKVLEDEVGSVKEEPLSFPSDPPVTRRQKLAKNVEQVQESPKPATTSAEAKSSATRRGKQRPKPPLRFDSKTNQIIEPLPPQAKPVRTSMVDNMRQAHTASVSPDTNAKNPTPKARKKASPKVAAKMTSKTSPKTTSKTTPKAAREPPEVTHRTTRQSALRGQSNQQSPDKAKETNTGVSPAAPPVESEVKLSPIKPRTTRMGTRLREEETASVLPAVKGQERAKYGNNTQGSTDDPIVLSSCPDSSALSDDDGFIPATDPTEVSPEETTRPETAPQAERQLLVDPGEQLNVAGNKQERILAGRPETSKPMHPVRRAERQVTAQKKTIIVKADPKNPVEVGFKRTNREEQIRIGPREVLSARDANALAQRNTSKANVLKRPPSTRDPVVDTSIPPRKVMKRSRSFSHKGLQQDYLSNLAAAESMPAKNKLTKEKLQEQKRVGGRRSRNEVSAVNQDLHAQIMASLQVRKESPPEVHDEQHGDTPEQEELAEPTRPKGPSDEVEEKLHGLVKTLVGHLQTKESTIYRGADAYRKNGIDSVGKIERRYIYERQQLRETWMKDAERYVRRSRSIQATLDKRGESREEARHRLEETLARRRHLFQKATTSLRALHGRLTEYQDEE